MDEADEEFAASLAEAMTRPVTEDEPRSCQWHMFTASSKNTPSSPLPVLDIDTEEE